MVHMPNWTALLRGAATRAGGLALAFEVRLRSWLTLAGPALRRAGSAVLRAGPVLRRGGRTVHHWTHEHHVGRHVAAAAGLFLVTLAGLSIGLLLGGHVHQDVGPFAAQFSMRPTLSGGTDVQIPPLGSLDLHSHGGPAHLSVALQSLDQKRAEAVLNNPNGITVASQNAVADVQHGVIRLAFQGAAAALLGALVVAAIVYRRVRRVAECGGLALLIIAASGVTALLTFRPNSVEEPQYHGLLSNAPAVIGDARSIANRFDAYKAELQRLVNNVSRLYGTVSTLPVYQPDSGTIRALQVSDLHLNPAAWPVIKTVVQQYQINLVLDTGDINDWGTQMESSFVDSIGTLGVPYVSIRGNHDSAVTAAAVGRQHNAVVLENSVRQVAGLTVAGIGDPRFTPDKSTADRNPGLQGAPVHQESELLDASGEQLASTIHAYGSKVDVALVHDPATAGGLAGSVPLVLAGHLHHRETSTLHGKNGTPTFLMVQGSTGGAGLRGLEGEEPTPLEMSVLYFDPKGALQAYDDITLGGTGQTEASINRHVIKNNLNPPPSESPSTSSGPAPSGSAGASPAAAGPGAGSPVPSSARFGPVTASPSPPG